MPPLARLEIRRWFVSGGCAALHRRLFIMSPLTRLENGMTQLNYNMKKIPLKYYQFFIFAL
jgi:hypothetical protein